MSDYPTGVDPVPAGSEGIIPHLVVAGAAAAIEFYAAAFGAEELGRVPGPDGKLMHASVSIDGSVLYLADDFPEMTGVSANPRSLGGVSVALHRFVPDVDAAVERAVAAGAVLKMPPTDMFWGDRYAQIVDPFGHEWALATHVRDVTPEEARAALETLAAEAAEASGANIDLDD
jgi:PhnB protein